MWGGGALDALLQLGSALSRQTPMEATAYLLLQPTASLIVVRLSREHRDRHAAAGVRLGCCAGEAGDRDRGTWAHGRSPVPINRRGCTQAPSFDPVHRHSCLSVCFHCESGEFSRSPSLRLAALSVPRPEMVPCLCASISLAQRVLVRRTLEAELSTNSNSPTPNTEGEGRTY